MTPIEFLLMHREKVLAAYTGSPGEAWKKLVEQIQIHDAMAQNSFNAILKAFVFTCRFYESRLNAGLNTDTGLNDRLNELSGLNAKLNTELETVKCELNKTIDGLNEKLNNADRLNAELNKTIDGLNNRLNESRRLNLQLNKQLVKYRLNILDDDDDDDGLNKLNTGIGLNDSDRGLNTMDEPVKSKLNISGWTVAKSGRYFRAFRKIKGRVYGVHLGLSLDDAESKIAAKIEQIGGGE